MDDGAFFGPEPPSLSAEQVRSWLIHEDDDVLVFDKPGWVVCHPSKRGPFSSLVGAAREVFAMDKIHLIARLDRETSGLILLARHPRAARSFQMAMADRRVAKRYRALLHGNLLERREVSEALGPDPESAVAVKQRVVGRREGQKAQTTFRPIECRGEYTLVDVVPHTGRKHQIRAHAQFIGHPVVGDKLYGPDETLYLDFTMHGWTARHQSLLPLRRQALHLVRMTFELDEGDRVFEAPWPADLEQFWNSIKA